MHAVVSLVCLILKYGVANLCCHHIPLLSHVMRAACTVVVHVVNSLLLVLHVLSQLWNIKAADAKIAFDIAAATASGGKKGKKSTAEEHDRWVSG